MLSDLSGARVSFLQKMSRLKIKTLNKCITLILHFGIWPTIASEQTWRPSSSFFSSCAPEDAASNGRSLSPSFHHALLKMRPPTGDPHPSHQLPLEMRASTIDLHRRASPAAIRGRPRTGSNPRIRLAPPSSFEPECAISCSYGTLRRSYCRSSGFQNLDVFPDMEV